MPSPFASTPQRIQVDGMNCIQPIAPAELGPMFRPKFDSILLIAARTLQGTSYAWPAPFQTCRSWSYESCSGCAGGVIHSCGSAIPAAFGKSELGSVKTPETTENVVPLVSIVGAVPESPRATPAPATASPTSRSAASRFISPA